MLMRLAGGVVPSRDRKVWPAVSTVDGPGAAVVVGPADADEAAVAAARTQVAGLVAAGGVVAAGAGVDLGGGFRSARLDGARGDRRDAVLAALRVLGPGAADRLGDRAGVLVTLFGPAATKPLGAAAGAAIRDGLWPVLRLASAASDLLGPEQVTTLLGLAAPDGVDAVPEMPASTLAGHLDLVLGPIARPRRLGLLVDLWERTCAEAAARLRRERLRASQGPPGRVDGVRRRRARYEDGWLLDGLRHRFGRDLSVADAARWVPEWWYWHGCLTRLVQDAMAATALARAAVAVYDHGPVEGLERCRPALRAAATSLSDDDAGAARRTVPGLPGVPARPGCYARDLYPRVRSGEPPTPEYVQQRLVRARDYAYVVLEAGDVLLYAAAEAESFARQLAVWANGKLTQWRAAAGYTEARPPRLWEQPAVFRATLGPTTLAQRLAAFPDTPPAEVERIGDLLWFADLADALAQLNGHEAAWIAYGAERPDWLVDPPVRRAEPLVPGTESIPAAVGGAANLVSLGARVPERPRTWPELVTGLLEDAAVAEALTGRFAVPAPAARLDGATVPGTGLRFEVARDPRRLAEWAAYMGNCIAGPDYVAGATEGRCVLVALRDPDGVVVANADLHHGPHGWRVDEIQGRFNRDPDSALTERFARWVAAIPPVPRPGPAVPPRPARGPARSGRPRNRLLQDVGDPLTRLAAEALADPATRRAVDVMAAVAARLPAGRGAARPEGAADGMAVLTALRRAAPARLDAACRAVLDTDPLADLWTATATRPLAAALASLDPELRARYEQLDRLVDDLPLPGSLRTLARRPAVAEARSVDLVARRLRAAIGRLLRDGDPVLAPSVLRRPTTPMVCALALAVSSWAAPDDPTVTPVAPPGAAAVPGFPPSTLDDSGGPWRRAWPDARELGAAADDIAAGGLVVPAAWLGAGGWSALWRRAAAAGDPVAATRRR